MAVLLAKVLLVVLFILMLRWTLPRFRFDQLMSLAWKGLIPLTLANLVGVAILVSVGLSLWLMLPISAVLFVAAGYASAFQFDSVHRQTVRNVDAQRIKQGVA